MKIITLDHLVIEVRDVEASLHFYSQVLGLAGERLAEFRQGQVPFPSVRAGNVLIDLFPSEKPGTGPNHFCLEVVESQEEILRELANKNLAFEKPGTRFGAKGNGFSVYITDPDGHSIEIRTYKKE